jgi:SprT protein
MTTIQPIGKQVQQAVTEEVDRYVEMASDLYRRSFPRVNVLFNLKGKAAGIYRYYYQSQSNKKKSAISLFSQWNSISKIKKQEIRFNPWLFSKYPEDSWQNTIPHEVAHYISDCLYGLGKIKPHGREWQKIMKDFGAEPQVRGNYDLEGIPTRKVSSYRYSCACREVDLSAYRHNKVQRGQQIYQCRDCSQPLVLSV